MRNVRNVLQAPTYNVGVRVNPYTTTNRAYTFGLASGSFLGSPHFEQCCSEFFQFSNTNPDETHLINYVLTQAP